MEILGQAPTTIEPSKMSWPFYFGAPIHYRFNGETGELLVGDREIYSVSESLEIKLIDYRWVNQSRWGREPQNWLDIAFVDAAGRVGVIALKKDGAINLYSAIEEAIRTTGLGAYCFSVVLQAQLQYVIDADEIESIYYTLTVAATAYTPEKEIEQIAAFLGSGKFDWIFVGEVADA